MAKLYLICQARVVISNSYVNVYQRVHIHQAFTKSPPAPNGANGDQARSKRRKFQG